jgi:hypothetical protein
LLGVPGYRAQHATVTRKEINRAMRPAQDLVPKHHLRQKYGLLSVLFLMRHTVLSAILDVSRGEEMIR